MDRPANRNAALGAATKSDVRYLLLFLLLWSMPVALTILSAMQQSIVASAIAAAAISCSVILFKPKMALVALPFFALLSPVAGYLKVFGADVLLSDLLFILLAFVLGVLYVTNKMHIYRNSLASLPTFVALLFLAGVVAGVIYGTLNSLKPALFLMQLMIIYLFTTTFATTEKSGSSIINAWLGAGFLGALLLIQAFVVGERLDEFKFATDAPLLNPEKPLYLLQATYYYAGFHYVLGISIVVLLLKFLLSESFLTKAFLVVILAILLLALFMMQNKTAMFGIVLSIAGVMAVLISLGFKKLLLRKFLLLILFCAMGYSVVFSSYLESIGAEQAYLVVERIYNLTSLEVRFGVYAQALTNWFSFPLQLLIGMGPDFLVDSGDADISEAFKMSSISGRAEGTVDSGWISYLIELGIVNGGALAALVVLSIGAVLKYLRKAGSNCIGNVPAVYVLGGLSFASIALFTQMLGYSKTAWFPFQLLIIGLMHKGYSADSSAK